MVADAPAGLVCRRGFSWAENSIRLCGLALATLGCVEGGSLAISAGAPVSAAIEGRITDCGHAVSGGEVVFRVQQDEPYQARPVDVEIGPVMTSRDGRYVVEIGPSFAVPGEARLTLEAVNGISMSVAGPDLSFTLGSPPRDTLRFDPDIGLHRGSCSR